MTRRHFHRMIALIGFFVGLNPMAVGQASHNAITGVRFSQVQGGDGVPLNVVEKGDPSKPAILFIHGFRQSYIAWTAQFESRLSEDCHLVAFDLRGHGNSGSPWQADAYNTSRPWAEDVESVIKATGIEAPLIVGWSFGGNVAMDFFPQLSVGARCGSCTRGHDRRHDRTIEATSRCAAASHSEFPI